MCFLFEDGENPLASVLQAARSIRLPRFDLYSLRAGTQLHRFLANNLSARLKLQPQAHVDPVRCQREISYNRLALNWKLSSSSATKACLDWKP